MSLSYRVYSVWVIASVFINNLPQIMSSTTTKEQNWHLESCNICWCFTLLAPSSNYSIIQLKREKKNFHTYSWETLQFFSPKFDVNCHLLFLSFISFLSTHRVKACAPALDASPKLCLWAVWVLWGTEKHLYLLWVRSLKHHLKWMS